jgi:hypothetical protein
MVDNQNDPFFRIKDMKRMGLPVWRQWSEFVHVASQDPDWWQLSDRDKSEIYKTNFDFEDPREMFKSDEARDWTPTDLEEVTNAYLSTDRDFAAIEDQNQRRAIKEGLIQSYNDYHMPERVKAEKEAVEKLSPDASKAKNVIGGEAIKKALVPELREQIEETERAAEAASKLSPEEQEMVAKRGIVNLAGRREAERPEAPEVDILTQQEAMKHYYGQAPVELVQKAGKQSVIPPSTAQALGRAEYYRQKGVDEDPINPSDRMGAIGVHESSYGVFKMLGLDEQAETSRKMVDENMRKLPADFEAAGAPEVGYLGEKIVADMFSSEGRDRWITMIREQGPIMGMMMLSTVPAGAIGQGVKGTMGAWVAQQMAQRIPESGIEAGSAYVAAINAGKSDDEALKAAAIVGSGNLALIAVDGLQALAPMAGASAFSRLASGKITSSGIAGLTKMGGALAGYRAGMESEAFEERFQEGLQQYVEGEAGIFEKTERTEEAAKAGRAMAAIMQAPGVVLAAPLDVSEGVSAARKSREIRDLAQRLGASEKEVASDIDAARAAAGLGAVPVEEDVTPAPRRFETDRELGVDEEEESLTAGLEEGRKEYFDALPDEEKEKIYNDGNEEFGRRMAVKMDEYELTPDEIDRFPDQEREQIKREAFADVLEKHKDETAAQEEAEKPPEPQKQPSKPAEPEARTPAPAAPVAAEPAVAPRMLTLKEMKAMLREATTPEEIDVLEREWNERGNPRSTNGPKAIAAARERVGLEQVAPDEEIGVLKATGSMSVSEAREGEPVRYTTEDGKVVEGVVRFQEDSDQVGIQDTGGQFTYVPSESVVETFRGPKPEPKPKRKAKRKAKPKLAKEVKPVPFDTKANYVDTETGEPVIAERMMNGRWIVERKDGTLEQTGEVELPDRYQRPGEELEPVTTEVVEEVVEEEVVPEPEPVVEPEPEPEETVEDILKKSEREVAGVKIPVNEKSFAPNAKKMKDAVRAATTEAELDEIQVIENNAIEDGYTKFRPSVQTAIDNKRAEFTGRPSPQQLAKERDKESKRILEEREAKEEAAPEPVKPRPKKKRKALGDKVVEAEKEAEAKAKPKPKKTKKKAQAPVDPAKEVKPKSTKKKTKTDARQDDPKLTKDKAGATKANDLINIINNTDNVEVVKQAWRVYTADVKHGRRKRRSPNVEKSYNNRLDELAGEKFKEDARPVPSAKPEPKPQPKETEDQAAERMERDMNAEWPTEAYEDVEYEEQYAYFADLDDARLIDEMYNEITHRWFMTNGIRDYIDPHFVQQVVNEMAKVNPDAAHAADDVYSRLFDEQMVDENRQLRLFLTQEYPGALTLKEAEGEAASGIAGSPRHAFSRWLELADIAEADAEEARAAALEEMAKPVVTAVQQERKVETVTEEELEAEGERLVEEADVELDEIETKGGQEEMRAEEQALRDMGFDEDTEADPVVEERVKKDYPSLGLDDRPFHVPTLEDVKRVFKKGWEIKALPGERGFNLVRKSDGMEIRILFTDVFEELKKKWEAKKGRKLNALESFAIRFRAKVHTNVFSKARKRGTVLGSKAGAQVPYGTFQTINGIHIITLDGLLADNITLWHESLHMWMRALATDEEISLVKRVFETEEEFTGFMSMMLEDEDQAMRMAEEAGASKTDAGLLRSLAKRIFDLSKKLAEALGYDVSEREAADLQELYHLSRRILHGDAYMAPQQSSRYIQDALTTGLVMNKDGSVYRGGGVRRRRFPAQRTPEHVEFADHERRNENANAELPAQIPDEPRVKEQDAGARPGGAEAENTPIVLKRRYERYTKSMKRWIKQNMTPSRGVDPELRKIIIAAVRLAEKGKWRGLAAHNRMKKIVNDLKEQFGKDRVSQSLAMVLDGRMSLGQFKRIFNLNEDSPAIQSLQEVLDYQDEVQDLLFKNDSLPQELRKRILANARYQTRFYAVHVLGSGWVTPDEHYITAVDALVDEFNGAVQRSLDKATAAAGATIQFDFGEYIYATPQRRAEMVEGLSDTRKAMVERAARDLGQWISAVENIRLESGVVTADWTTDSLRSIAENTIDGYLDNAVLKGKAVPGPIGGMPVTNMMHRKLDKIFRDLYGEVQDPGSRMARTMEVQSTLLATSTMFQKMYEEGFNKWWSEGRKGDFSKRLSEKEHGGSLTPGDRRRYGSMAGKWVTQETYDLIHQSGTFQKEMDTGLKAYAQWVQGVTRGTRLLWWKTAARNFLTSVTSFAFGSGDVLESGWGSAMAEGTKLAARIGDALIFGRDPEALEILADLVEKDIFDVRQETQLAEIQANLDRLTTEGVKGKALKPLKIAMQAYGLIDLPAKYASYQVRRKKGDTHEQAVEHLHKFYQYRDSVPEFVTKVNRLGLGDYFGYTWDSGRIMIDQMKHMVEQARKGNLKPLLGLTMRMTIPAFRYGTGTAFKIAAPVATAKIAAHGLVNVLTQLGMGEDDDDELFRVATAEEITQLRHSLPSYDRDQPLAVWYEREKPGDPWTIKWQVLGDLSAFPLEDVVLGAWQSASQDPDRNFGQTLLNNLSNASPLSIGMMPENLWKLFTGNESIVGPRFKEPGLIDVASDYARARRTGTPIRSDYDNIIGNRMFDFFGDSFVPGQTFRMLDKLLEVKYGKDPMLGRAIDTPEYSDVSDIMFRLIRKYDRGKDTQERVLKDMISGELEGYKNEKWLAGAAGREGLRTKQGANKSEILESERARENWHAMLKSIEGKIAGFRILTKGNFTDQEIKSMLKNTDLRSGEIDHIINGTVGQMKAKEFKFDHKPKATQRGDAEVIEYFEQNKTINYRDIHNMLEEAGYVPGKYGPGFRSRVKKLRREWNTSDKSRP